MVFLKGLLQKRAQDGRSVRTHLLLLLVFRKTLAHELFQQVLFDNLAVVLSEVLRVGSGKPNNGSASCVDDVDTHNHCVLHLFGNFNPIQIFSEFRVNLLEYVGVNGDLGAVNRCGQNYLTWNAFRI